MLKAKMTAGNAVSGLVEACRAAAPGRNGMLRPASMLDNNAAMPQSTLP